MEKKNLNMEEQSFFSVPQRVKAERMEKLFSRAVGDELVEKREEMVKHFDMGANRYQAVIYSEPVHFRESEDQDWQEIDNTLEETVNEQGRRVLRNRANRMHVEFPQEMDGGNMAAITDGGKTFAWRFEEEAQPIRAKIRTGAQLKHERLVKQAQKLPKYVGRTVESLQAADLESEMETEQERRGDIAKLKAENSYENVLPGVSVRYTLGSEKVKEDIILADAAALKHAKLRLPKGFDYEVTAGKQLLIKEDGKVVFTMETPIVYDAAGKETIADIVLTDCGEYIRLEYMLDAEYMAEARFPVTIDPVLHSTNAAGNIYDTTLGEGQSLIAYNYDHMKVGKYGGSVRCVGLLRFDSLAILPASDTVIGAVLRMYSKSSSASNCIAAYEVLKDWNQTNVTWANFNPDSTSSIAADALECVAGGSAGTALDFDLTNLYRKWCTRDANGNSNNHGVAFRSPSTVTATNYSEIYSANASTAAYRPVMYLNYISHAGLEGWWLYEQMSAGRAGTVYADLFNGNMVLEHSDTAMSGNRMPVSVNHYYNSCKSDDNAFNCGYGWKTDAHQKITAKVNNDTNYFVWEDGDGTEHYFEVTGSQPYKDCEGMEMELTYTSGSPAYITITDKEHNSLRFNVVETGLAWLVSASDACSNTVTYAYVADHEAEGRIDTITDPVGRVTKFNYSGSLLYNIRIPAANGYRYVYFTYDSSNRLTGVRYSELSGTSAHTTYGYEGSTNLLTSARNYDGIQVNVEYEVISLYGTVPTNEARHLVALETQATDSNGSVQKYGARQEFEYKHMCTVVTAVSGNPDTVDKRLHYQFNAAGNVICVRDDLGYARFTKFSDTLENKPTAESSLRRAVTNLLLYPDLSAGWTAGGNAVKDTATTCMGAASVKLTANGGTSLYRQAVTLPAGQKYTFSAYVKTQDIEDIFGAYLRLSKVSNVLDNVCSDLMYGTNAAALDNGMGTDGWERVCMTIDLTDATEDTAYYADLVLAAESGYAWFACPQIEVGGVMNSVNLLSNGDFRLTTVNSNSQTVPQYWTAAANTLSTSGTGVFTPTEADDFPEALSGNYLAMNSKPNTAYIGFQQYVNLTGAEGDVFTLGGWVDSHSVPFGNDDMRLSLLLRFKKTDGTWSSYSTFKFNHEWVGWQFGCFAAVAPAAYTQVELTISYIDNCNVSKFSNIFLYREAFGQSFAYDDDKNLVAVSTLSAQKSDIKYDSAKNITVYTQPGRDSSVEDNRHLFYYGDTAADRKKHLLWRSRTPMHVTDYYSYDGFGNTTASRRVNYGVYENTTADSAYPYIRTETAYDEDGNYATSTKDARGNQVTQVVDANDGTLTSVTDPNGQAVNYTYDDARRVTAVQTTGDGKTYRNGYTYEEDRIKTVSHNTTDDNTNDVTYTFGYDDLGRKTTVKVGTQVLSTNEYDTGRNTLLTGVEYGNGGKVGYTYDQFDRLTAVRHDDDTEDRLTYEYGANGQVAQVTHVVDENITRYARTDYDLADRPCQTVLHESVDGGNKERLYKTLLKYDKLNNLTQFAEDIQTEIHTTGYTYDRDNRVTEIAYDGSTHKVKYTYDALGRVATRVAECGATAGKLTSTYGYVGGGYGTNSTTPLVASIAQEGVALSYAYDTRGNITSETRNGKTTTYVYDALGQLVRVSDPHDTTADETGTTWVFSYDRGGNITSKTCYVYTTDTLGWPQDTIQYAYGDTNWKDKLTAYNGRTFTYDAIGNPTNDGIWSYEWEVGRRLKSMNADGGALYFKYDHNGLRTQKVVQQDWYPVTYNYLLHGKLITHMTVDYTDWDEVAQKDVLHFFYDAQSRPAKVSFNSVIYTYIHNLQGDIIGLLDSAGNLVVEYKYDAWGKLLSTDGTLADTLGKRNPFRYRGYIYDEESGLYYLRSRYYNPEWSRFINMDGMLTAGLLMANGFAYCSNDPVRRTDADGANWITDGLKKFGNFIKECFQAQAKANVISAQQTVYAANKIGNAAKKAARSVGNFVKKALRAQVEADILTAEMNARAVSNLIDGAKKIANKVGNTLKKAFQAQQQADIISAQMVSYAGNNAIDWAIENDEEIGVGLWVSSKILELAPKFLKRVLPKVAAKVAPFFAGPAGWIVTVIDYGSGLYSIWGLFDED